MTVVQNNPKKVSVTITYDPESPGGLMISTDGLNDTWGGMGIIVEALILIMKSHSKDWRNPKQIDNMEDLQDYVADYIDEALIQHKDDDVVMIKKEDVN